jgi:nucleoid-associated protein YgaU
MVEPLLCSWLAPVGGKPRQVSRLPDGLDARLETQASHLFAIALWAAPDEPLYASAIGRAAREGDPARRRARPSTRERAMGLLDFVKDAGEKLFGIGKAKAAMQEVAAAPADEAKIKAANDAAADAIMDYIHAQNLDATGLTVTFDGAASTVSVFGVAPDQATKEKIALCCGNVAGVAAVNNMMSVDTSEPEGTYYTVVSGDTLSKISKNAYGDPNKYQKIFEANTPMLKHPDKIYPGQVLRIPPL